MARRRWLSFIPELKISMRQTEATWRQAGTNPSTNYPKFCDNLKRVNDVVVPLLAFLTGIASGFIGALSTGGGLISIPALIFLGLTPSSAIATTQLSALSGGLSSLLKYRKNNVIKWKYLPYFIITSILGGYIGSKILLTINEDLLTKIVGVLLLLILPLIFFQKDFGTIKKITGKRHIAIGIFLQFLIMIYGAMFGGGTGIFLTYVLVYFFGMTFIESNATGTVMWIFATTTALIAFILSGIVNFVIGIPLMIGAIIGGYIGAHVAIKKGNSLVRWVFLVIIIFSSIKLLFS